LGCHFYPAVAHFKKLKEKEKEKMQRIKVQIREFYFDIRFLF